MKTKFKYIHFVKVECLTRTTGVWLCLNTKSDVVLGQVKWYSGWRRYCFYPAPETVYSSGCLVDITNFIDAQMAARTGDDRWLEGDRNLERAREQKET